MRKLVGMVLLLAFSSAFGQTKTAQDFGFRHIVFRYKSDSVDILIKSKKGEENEPKPLFFFCQGSLPIPLIIHEGPSVYGTFPFDPDSLTDRYHLAIVGKPGIPLIAAATDLQPNFTVVDSTGNFPGGYVQRNLLSYYIPRNLAVVRHLRKQDWISKRELVVAGHSEGSTIAAKMAAESKGITHLIYSGGNPMGRILSIVQQGRASETDTDSTRYGEEGIGYWAAVVANKNELHSADGDSYRATYEFSEPMLPYLLRLSIPVLVCYGTKDWNAPYNDLLRVEAIRKHLTHIAFRAFIGLEHNYFPVNEGGRPDHGVFNWDKVAGEWARWLSGK